MSYIFIADDFTGASDTLATLARAGYRARLFRDLPAVDDLTGLDVWGIATDARSLGRKDIAKRAQYIGKGLTQYNPQFLHLKVCSTFDSSYEIGNIALLAEELAHAAGIKNIAVIGGQPSLDRYAIFGTLFARAPDGHIHRIDRHPIMSVHPVTPMREADLICHFNNLGLKNLNHVARGIKAASFPRFYDILDQQDIAQAGSDLLSSAQASLVIGASSVAEAWIESQLPRARPKMTPTAIKGPVFCFAGSRSSLTTAQVAAAKTIARLPINPTDVLETSTKLEQARVWVLERLARGQDCITYLTADSAGNISAADLATQSALFVKDVLSLNSAKALVVAGGDTSSAIVNALAPSWLEYAGSLCPGVSVLQANLAEKTLPLVLKGGQMGKNDFFQSTIEVLKAPSVT